MRWSRILYILIILTIIFFGIWLFFLRDKPSYISIREVANQIADGEIKKITVSDDELEIIYIDENQPVAESRKEAGIGIFETLREMDLSSEQINAVELDIEPSSRWPPWISNLGPTLSITILIGLFFFFILRQAQQGNQQTIDFNRSRARLLTGQTPHLTFDDVGGLEEAKQALQLIVKFLREPEIYISLGSQLPKGVLLTGPSGSGKTMLAQALAGEAGVPFFYANASEFIEMFVGVGAARIRDLFDQAKRNSPCIVFIDEIDSIGGRRALTTSGGYEERDQALNQLLAEIDGFETDTNIIVVGATNRPQILDPALTRPGRFDQQVALDLPDEKARQEILGIYFKGKPLADDVDSYKLAKGTSGFSGADLAAMVNYAAIRAAELNQRQICFKDFEEIKNQMIFKLDGVPSPQGIHHYLDQFVIGQNFAKKVLSVAVSNHYARIEAIKQYAEHLIHIKKSNVLVLGPTGTGKTLLAEVIARYLQVPFTIINATVLTKTGYIGADAEYVLYKLLETADFNIRKAEYGIVCIDEIDKLSILNDNTAGTIGVQQDLLKIIEGSIVDVPKEGGRFSGNVEYYQINTKNILFICQGAFVGLDKIIRRRLGQSDVMNRPENLLRQTQPDDIINYGFIPELVGRLPIITATEPLSMADLARILVEPKDSLVNQYTELLKLQGWQARFTPEAVGQIANEAIHQATGARGLQTILEIVLLDSMYRQDGNGAELLIDERFVAARFSREVIDRASPVGSLLPSGSDAAVSSSQEVTNSPSSEENLSQIKSEAPCQKCGATERAVLSSGTYCANCGRQLES